METANNLQLRTCQKTGILLILFVGFALCMLGSSSSSEVARCELNSGSNNLDISSFCSSKKYIVKSYFEKYESFSESNFQDFTKDELFSCKLLPDNLDALLRESVLNRLLVGEGSHRRLHSSIRLHFQSESTSQLSTHFCKIIIIERLPSGVFADPFELQHLLHRGAVFGDTNLELPSVASNRSVVEIHMNVTPTIFTGQTSEQEISIDLPLHARYPPLGESDYAKVEFGAPDIFMDCNFKGTLSNQSCLFAPSSDFAESKAGDILWRIPCGTRAHAAIVSAVTFVTAFISTLIILATSLSYSDINFAKSFKLS
ncbi:phosphatidylinositol-glycan biosynthesis class X protein isoform X2 [Jatropha curcas]|uniref:phosphatidylinositol-glycan biosynthesis class X protein isoform X2 n=1 Tax=Jatropha curcas TaxID=180498 RepID=UPI0005FBBB7A|nr:phosphatidylinositol-glycan biosynthesis class X protein isoform X2 [Jatropha curcas]